MYMYLFTYWTFNHLKANVLGLLNFKAAAFLTHIRVIAVNKIIRGMCTKYANDGVTNLNLNLNEPHSFEKH